MKPEDFCDASNGGGKGPHTVPKRLFFYSFYKKHLTPPPPRPLFIKVGASFSRLLGGFRQFLAVFRRLSAGFQAAHRTKQKWHQIFYKWV